ncbi:hypothetical protein [Niastella koreensis]|uniref:hypothetical protein n=1 Tax=Niastella koreensis TaxID=354356 RepID=UPI0003109450|nr:hypothetical protein [Niastella koreensis]
MNPLITKQDKDIDAITRQYLKHQKTTGVVIGILKDRRELFMVMVTCLVSILILN